MSGMGRGVVGWFNDILSGGSTELVKEELELRDVCRDREGLRNIREKKLFCPPGPTSWTGNRAVGRVGSRVLSDSSSVL